MSARALKLGDDFFILYPSYLSQLRASGIHLGMMKKYPECKQDLADLYTNILWTGVPRLTTLHNMGDINIRLAYQGRNQSSSLFRMGSLILMCKLEKDYLAYYVTGAPVSTMLPIFSLANAEDMSNKLRKYFLYTYELSDKWVSERLLVNSKAIDEDIFDEFYCPFPDIEGYCSIVERYLAGCLDMKELMRQRNSGSSVIKPNDADIIYAPGKAGFLNGTREQRYIV
jgi:hypothetical protein